MSAIASDGAAAWKAQLDRPPFVDADTERAIADGRDALQRAIDEGFTDFVVVGLVQAPLDNAYTLKLFSRPRVPGALMHVVQTADAYVKCCLEAKPS